MCNIEIKDVIPFFLLVLPLIMLGVYITWCIIGQIILEIKCLTNK